MAESKQVKTPWLASRMNEKQTPEQRRTKYALARELGASPVPPSGWLALSQNIQVSWTAVPPLPDRRAMGLLVFGVIVAIQEG